MTNQAAIQASLVFHQAVLEKLQTAYLQLVDGGVQSYTIDDRSLTRLDLGMLSELIRQEESKICQLTAQLNGGKPRRAYSILPRDW